MSDAKKYGSAESQAYCKPSIYSSHISGKLITCDYILRTKHRRPCPPGLECTERLTHREYRALIKSVNRETV